MSAVPGPDTAASLAEESTELLTALAGRRLLVVGDVMVDRFVRGQVERISPEAPIPVLRVEGDAALPGGAANVARNAAALGAMVELVGVIGEDEEGRRLSALMATVTGALAWLVVDRSRPTTVKTRFLAGAHQLLRTDAESVGRIAGDAAVRLQRQVVERLAWAEALVLSDYGKGALSEDLALPLIAAGRRAGCFVAVDPRGADWERYRGADLVTPNRRELAEAAGGCGPGLDEVAATAKRLIRAHGLGAVLVTLSEQGMLAVDGAGGCVHLPALAREVFDVSGAGDTVIATAATAMAAGAALPSAARLANIAAGIVVAKLGPGVAWPQEILAALGREEESCSDKIATRAQAMDQIRRWRLAGLKVGFTNGCFDLLHPGHVALLTFAHRQADRLVVAINDDASVTRLKGPGRPVRPLAARMAVLAALGPVDLVVPFGEDTPMGLIEAIRPDVLVKGADYSREGVVGASLVEGYGGTVLLAPLIPGHSTTATIAGVGLKVGSG